MHHIIGRCPTCDEQLQAVADARAEVVALSASIDALIAERTSLRAEGDRLGATAATLREAAQTALDNIGVPVAQTPRPLGHAWVTLRAALAADPDEWLRARIEREVGPYREALDRASNFVIAAGWSTERMELLSQIDALLAAPQEAGRE